MNSPLNKFLLIAACGLFALMTAAVLLWFSPLLTKNVMFLAMIPFAALFVLVMFLDAKWMMILLLYTRALLDPILNMTKLGDPAAGGQASGAGMGAVLNLLVIALVATLIFRFPKEIQGHRKFIKSWLIFLTVCFLSALFSPDRMRSFKLCMNFVTYLCIVLIPFIIVKDQKDKKFWIKTLLFSSFIPVIMSYVGVATHFSFFYAFNRLRGTFTHSNILAFYMVFVVAVIFYILRTRQFRLSFGKKFALFIYMLMAITILVITETRSAWISCACLFLIYSLLKERKFFFIFIIVTPLVLMVPQIQTRLNDLSEGTGERKSDKLNSMAWRMQLWQSSVDSIKRRPFFGYGLGSFEILSANFFKLEKKGAPAHNSYLELLFETGIIGLLSYLAIYWQAFQIFLIAMKSKVKEVSTEAVLVFSYAMGYLLVGSADNTLYYLAFNWYFWFFIGLILQSMEFNKIAADKKAASPASPA